MFKNGLSWSTWVCQWHQVDGFLAADRQSDGRGLGASWPQQVSRALPHKLSRNLAESGFTYGACMNNSTHFSTLRYLTTRWQIRIVQGAQSTANQKGCYIWHVMCGEGQKKNKAWRLCSHRRLRTARGNIFLYPHLFHPATLFFLFFV